MPPAKPDYLVHHATRVVALATAKSHVEPLHLRKEVRRQPPALRTFRAGSNTSAHF